MYQQHGISDGNVHSASAKRSLAGSCAVCELPSDHKSSGVHVRRLPCGHVTHQNCWQEYVNCADNEEPLSCPFCGIAIPRYSRAANLDASKTKSPPAQLGGGAIPVQNDWPLIVVVGRIGTGKSTFVQYFTSQVAGCGHSTVKVNAYVCWSASLGDFYLVDTPGFDETDSSLKDTLEEIQRWWKKTCPKDVRISGIIYLNKFLDDTMFGEPLIQLRLLRDLCCGQDPLQLTVFATLDWHLIDRSMLDALEEELIQNALKPFVDLGGQVYCLDGSMSAAERLLLCFLVVAPYDKSKKVPDSIFNDVFDVPELVDPRDSAVSTTDVRSSDSTLVAGTDNSSIHSNHTTISPKQVDYDNYNITKAYQEIIGGEDPHWIDVIPEKRSQRISTGEITITDTFLQQLLQQPEEKPLLRLSDRFKLYVEYIIGTEVIWRPFLEPRRMVKRPASWSRFTYKCECGELYYLSDSVPTLRPLTIDSVKGIQFHLNTQPQPRSSSGRGTAPITSAGSSSQVQNTSSNVSSGPSAPASNSNTNTNTQQGQTAQQPATRLGFTGYVNWCVNTDPASTHLDELDVCRDVNEHSFINVLLARYERTVGWKARWTLYQCGGVRFKKFYRLHKSDPIVSCGKEELPDNAEYQYLRDNPFVSLEEHRAILEDLFKHRLRHRKGHGHTELLIRTPRKTPDRVPDALFADGYGMHAYAVLSLQRLLTLLAIFSLLNLPGLWFLIHWLKSNPGDWQNASVPMIMTLALDMLLIAYVQIVAMAGSTLPIRD